MLTGMDKPAGKQSVGLWLRMNSDAHQYIDPSLSIIKLSNLEYKVR